jgi:FHS family L-fucose permease-like MFS transporter
MVVAWTYAIAVNFVPAYTITVDKVGESTVGLEERPKDEEAVVTSTVDHVAIDEKHSVLHVER